MILLICILIAMCNSCYTRSETVENVYIETLVQRYLTEEKNLWSLIYSNDSSLRYSIMDTIKRNHQYISRDRYFNDVMSMEKLIKYVNFSDIRDSVEKYEQLILTNSVPEPYITADKAFSVYNYTLEFFRFDSQQICTNWSTEVGSSSQNLYMFYEILSANILTTYMKSQRVNMLQVIKKGFEVHDWDVLRTRFKSMYNQIANSTTYYMGRASSLIWMCDKNATEDDGTARQITNFIQGYVDNEINLNEGRSCWGSCSDYKFAKNHGCFEGTFCNESTIGEPHPVCRGTIIDCSYIEEKMEVCPSVNGRNRRYEYINYGCTTNDRSRNKRCKEDGRYFGPSGNCYTNTSTLQSFRSGLTKCDHCFCYCDEHRTDSDRYFSLQPVVSDVSDNMIVDGVAIIKRNGIFSWTITQSKLLRDGRVEQFQNNPRSNIKYSNITRSDPGIVDGVDYYTLAWYNRSVSLDIISLPHGRVVTGVRFAANREFLSVQVHSTKFDFNSGTLLDDSEWVSSDSAGEKTNLKLDRPGLSNYYDIYQAFMSIPDFTPNKFIKFRPSDEDKDAAQTTVPFIDTQLVRPKYASPLSGVGIYYKGKDGLGGFIAPTVLVYNMSSHIGNTLLPELPSATLNS